MAKAAEAELPASAPWRLFLVGFGMLQITLGAGLIVGRYTVVVDESETVYLLLVSRK